MLYRDRGVARPLQTKLLKGCNYKTVSSSNIFYSWECHSANDTAIVPSNTRVLLLISKIYTTENKHMLGIYAVVNQVTLSPKEMIHMFVT